VSGGARLCISCTSYNFDLNDVIIAIFSIYDVIFIS